MENNEKDIEDLFKNRFKDEEAFVPERVWANIKNTLPAPNASSSGAIENFKNTLSGIASKKTGSSLFYIKIFSTIVVAATGLTLLWLIEKELNYPSFTKQKNNKSVKINSFPDLPAENEIASNVGNKNYGQAFVKIENGYADKEENISGYENPTISYQNKNDNALPGFSNQELREYLNNHDNKLIGKENTTSAHQEYTSDKSKNNLSATINKDKTNYESETNDHVKDHLKKISKNNIKRESRYSIQLDDNNISSSKSNIKSNARSRDIIENKKASSAHEYQANTNDTKETDKNSGDPLMTENISPENISSKNTSDEKNELNNNKNNTSDTIPLSGKTFRANGSDLQTIQNANSSALSNQNDGPGNRKNVSDPVYLKDKFLTATDSALSAGKNIMLPFTRSDASANDSLQKLNNDIKNIMIADSSDFKIKNPDSLILDSIKTDDALAISDSINKKDTLSATTQKTKEEKNNNFFKKLSVDLLISPGTTGLTTSANLTDQSSIAQADQKKTNTTGAFTWSGGLRINYSLSPRIMISVGVFYSQYAQKYSLTSQTKNFNYYVPDSTISYKKDSIGADTSHHTIYGPLYAVYNHFLTQKDSTHTYPGKNAEDTYTFITIPVSASYKIINKRIGLSLLGGITTNILVKGITYYTDDTQTELLSTSTFTSVSLGVTGGVSLSYKITKNISFILEPNLNYFLSNIQPAGFFMKQNPHTFNINTGFRFNF